MTEADWLTCSDPTPMLTLRRGKASDRKLRLFACACCRRVWPYLEPRRARVAVEVSERYADRLASRHEMRAAAGGTTGLSHAEIGAGWAAKEGRIMPRLRAAHFAAIASSPLVGPVERKRRDRLDYPLPDAVGVHARAERVEQCVLARDIFGNPFRPVVFDPDWRTPSAVALARGMYEGRDFAHLPILADALEDAGCGDPDIIGHCRGPGPHVRGCWVVDLVLGKE